MDTLYAASGSTSLVAAVLLEECEHAYTLETMNLYVDGAGNAAYSDINPWRQVPALQTTQGLITETIAIAEYLDQTHQTRHLWPVLPWQRVQAVRWYSCLSTTLQPYVRCLVRPERFIGEDAAQCHALQKNIAQLLVEKLTLVDAELATRDWLAGDDFGPADALLATMLGWFKLLRLPVASLERLREHEVRCRARPAFQRASDRHGLVPNLLRARSTDKAALSAT